MVRSATRNARAGKRALREGPGTARGSRSRCPATSASAAVLGAGEKASGAGVVLFSLFVAVVVFGAVCAVGVAVAGGVGPGGGPGLVYGGRSGHHGRAYRPAVGAGGGAAAGQVQPRVGTGAVLHHPLRGAERHHAWTAAVRATTFDAEETLTADLVPIDRERRHAVDGLRCESGLQRGERLRGHGGAFRPGGPARRHRTAVGRRGGHSSRAAGRRRICSRFWRTRRRSGASPFCR